MRAFNIVIFGFHLFFGESTLDNYTAAIFGHFQHDSNSGMALL